MGGREQRGRTTPGSEVALGSCKNQAQDHALRGGQRAGRSRQHHRYEALRLLVSFVMSTRDEKSHALMFMDITRAPPALYATTGVGAATGGRSA